MELLILIGALVSLFLLVLIIRFLVVVPDHLSTIAKYLRWQYFKDEIKDDDDEDDGVRMF